jgi:polar amino acid transport system permease protein
MSTFNQIQGAGQTRPPGPPASEIPAGSTFLLIAGWLLLAEGGLAFIFLPVLIFSAEGDVPPAKIAGFAAFGVLLLVAGTLLFARWAWALWVAAGVALAAATWLAITGGLVYSYEPYAVWGFTVVELVLMLLGRRAAGRPEAMALASANIPFRVKLTAVWISIFFILGLLFALSQFDAAWMRENFRFIATGLIFTILLAAFAIALAVILALLGALGRLSRNPVAYGVSGFYTSFFRGTPLIVQLFLIFLALPQIAQNFEGRLSLLYILSLTPFQAGVLGLGLNYGAYMTEIFRAGIQSVSHGQAEAADALGMGYAQRMRRVVLPQAARVIIPPTGNEFIAMMKDTALVSVLGSEIARAEVFRRAQIVGPPAHKPLEALILAAGLYWGLTAVFTFFQARLERRMSKGYVRTEARRVTGQKRPQFLPAAPAMGGDGIESDGADTGPGGVP